MTGVGQAAHRLMMCAPTAYDLKYEINPWMSLENRPDTGLARRQWAELHAALSAVPGVSVDLIPQAPECPDMVFTANAGLIRGSLCLLARFRHPERQREEPHFRAWFEANGFTVVAPDPSLAFEGEGDALFAGDFLVAGYLKRSDIRGHAWVAAALEMPVLSLELVDDRWYHLDTCFVPLGGDLIAWYPAAFDEYAQRVVRHTFRTIEVEESEALRFACNAVPLGNTVVVPAGCPRFEADLAHNGFATQSVPMTEFLKAGGACKCLTLLVR